MTPIHIVGGGLAGLLCAQHLVDLGWESITVYDDDDPLAASNAPTAICHPFPGRSLQPHRLLNSAYLEAQKWMTRWQEWDLGLAQALTMVRPCDGPGGERLHRSWVRHWQDTQPPWGQIVSKSDPIRVEYGPCFAVMLGELRTIWKQRLKKRGVAFRAKVVPTNEVLVLCPGRTLSNWLPSLPLNSEGGELGTFETPQPLEHLISRGGFHIAPSGRHHVVVGATRWQDETSPDPMHAIPVLQPHGAGLWPSMGASASVWQGVRCIQPSNRLPIAGPIPNRPNTWVLGAFGAKGLLWGPLAAAHLIDDLTGVKSVPDELSTHRFHADELVFQWPLE